MTRPSRRRLALGLAAVATLATSACAAGQIAQTANVKPSLDGVNRQLHDIGIRALSIDAPSGPSYQSGSAASISVVFVNIGHQPDALTNVTSSQAGGWNYQASGTAKAGPPVGAAPRVPLPAGAATAIGASGKGKLSLVKIKNSIFPGTEVPVTFTFERAGTITIPVPVHLSETPTPQVVSAQPGEGAAG